MIIGRILHSLAVFFLAIGALCSAAGRSRTQWIHPYKRVPGPLQDIVTWDDKSIFVNGERVMLFSGEIHPFRIPVPSLWLDVLQKIKALGYNCVSIYIDWALHEGKPGDFTAEGVFAWEPFFDAAKEAGLYVLARPGPYINAEVSGGGFPGWLQRVNGTLRSSDEAYLASTNNYVRKISEIVAKAQITNGGPVILVQPENEYTGAIDGFPFPQFDYWQYVVDQYRYSGIIVPLISNEAWTRGAITPTTQATVDIYGHDGYPLGFDCANPDTWPDSALPSGWWTRHLETSPTTPYSIVEFQGGAFDPWGGNSFAKCLALVSYEFERVFYKNNFGYGVAIFNVYMTYGGTNWGNLGHAGGYTSYDYGAVVSENRLVDREKYSEAKLQANFLQASPAYLLVDHLNATKALTTDPGITVTPGFSNTTKFYWTRHSTYNSINSTSYKLHISSATFGNITVPQLNNSLTLSRRDAKAHVSDYKVGKYNLIYSTAEIFTWKEYDADRTVLVVYGGPDEHHEIAVQGTGRGVLVEGTSVQIVQKPGYTILNWAVSPERKIVQVNAGLYIYIVDRNEAYNYWVPATPASYGRSAIIARAGYLLRTAEMDASSLHLTGDVNATTPIEIIGGASSGLSKLIFNGESIPFEQDSFGVVTATIDFVEPKIDLPDLSALDWRYIDSLPEIQQDYSDVSWPDADLEHTYNSMFNQSTPTSLFGGDYGFHTGSLIFHGHFVATGSENTLFLSAIGGSAYGHSVFLNDTFLGSWVGNDRSDRGNNTFSLPNLVAAKPYVFTVIVDNMGLDENWVVGEDEMKTPRGILNYTLSGHPQSDITWKITGNLGGEDYADRIRGPLNEGALYIERQGYHLPSPPVGSAEWSESVGPTAGISSAGIGYFATSFDLDLPAGYDIPLNFVFTNSTTNGTSTAYRAQLFVNGWQFGKYVHNIGPQTAFPVPEGILNYHGTNWLGVSLWALEASGAKIEKLELKAEAVIKSGYGKVEIVDSGIWKKREGAY